MSADRDAFADAIARLCAASDRILTDRSDAAWAHWHACAAAVKEFHRPVLDRAKARVAT